MVYNDETGRENDAADDVSAQLDAGETLDKDIDDQLDEGFSPPDRPVRIDVPTQAEEERGLSLDELLSAEEPDVGAGDSENLFDETGGEVGDARAGRLVDTDQGEYADTEDELLGGDVGIDGAGASAEEAAVHVIDPR